MKQVASTGRYEFQSELTENIVIHYTKTVTKTDVFINGEVKKDDETVGSASYEAGLNRFSMAFKKFDAVTVEERSSIAATIMNDVNEMIQ